MFLKILSHPIFMSLNYHMPMIVDLSHPLIMLGGENGCGKSTLLHSIYYAFRGEEIPNYAYRLQPEESAAEVSRVLLFDAEQHNPRNQLHLFKDDPQMKEFLETASHGQIMLSLFRQTFPSLPEGSLLLLDEPEMALSQSNQKRVVEMLLELVGRRKMRIIAATHSPALLEASQTYVINMDNYINRNVVPTDMPTPGQGIIH